MAASLMTVAVNGQTRTGSGATVPSGWTPPRAADGHPDLSGVWAHNAATPMERPKELEGRAELTDAELAALQRTAAQLFDGNGDAALVTRFILPRSTMCSARRKASPRGTPARATTTRSGSSIAGSRSGPR